MLALVNLESCEVVGGGGGVGVKGLKEVLYF